MIESPPTSSAYDFFSRLRLPEERGFLEFRSFDAGAKTGRVAARAFMRWPPPEDFDKEFVFAPELEHYFGVLLRTGQDGRAVGISAGSVCWVEFDLGGSKYLSADKNQVKGFGYPVLREAAAAMWMDIYDECLGLDIPPMLAVSSGQGLHVYWGLATTKAAGWIETANKGLAKLFAPLGAEVSTYDKARILRVPGTRHLKNPQRPLPVDMMYTGDTRLDPERLKAFVEAETPKPLPRAFEAALERGLSAWVPSDADIRLLLESWQEGERNQKSMAFGGWCAQHGVPEHVALDLMDRICRETGDDEPENRRQAVARSYQRYREGLPGLGFTTLKRMVPGLEGKGVVQLGVLSPSASDAAMGEALPEIALPPDYRLGDDGSLIAVKIKTTRYGAVEEYETLARRWIQLRGVLTDLATGESHLTLAWPGAGGEVIEETLPYGQAVTRAGLLSLASRRAPVDEINAGPLTRYIQACYAWNREVLPEQQVASHLGWHHGQFILPGTAVRVLGVDEAGWAPQGSLSGWLEALEVLLSWGVTPALVAVALSATAPFVRRLGLAKNPILALSTTSHTGKTSAVRFALSLWANPEYNESLYFDAATINGLMGRLMTRQDLPVGLDDHQRYEDRQVGELLHLLAGGAERARAKRDGGERLARRWRGAAILTGETSALREAMGTGAVNRLIELDDYPLGTGKGEVGLERSEILRLGSANWGTARGEVLERLDRAELAERVGSHARGAMEAGAPGDLVQHLGLLASGVEALASLIDRDGGDLARELVDYLARKLVAQREQHGSLAGRAMIALRSMMAGYLSSEGADELLDGKQLIAFQRSGIWYVNPAAKEVERVMKPFGGLDTHLAEWAREGRIDFDESGGKKRLKVKRSWRGVYSYYVALLPQEEPDE